MRKLWIVACVVLFASAPGFARTPGKAPLSSEVVAAILGGGACASQGSHAVFAAKGPAVDQSKSTCSATASCGGTATVSCNGTSSCSAQDRNCDLGIRGQVTCDTVTTQCSQACSCGTVFCCQCDATGDCFACCRCGGGSPGSCIISCGG